MDASTTPRYLGIQGRGTIALPADVRRRLHLDEPGAQLEMVEREDGVLELRAALPIPADQRWFWTGRWQEREHEVDEHVEAGRVTTDESTEDIGPRHTRAFRGAPRPMIMPRHCSPRQSRTPTMTIQSGPHQR